MKQEQIDKPHNWSTLVALFLLVFILGAAYYLMDSTSIEGADEMTAGYMSLFPEDKIVRLIVDKLSNLFRIYPH